MSVLRYTKLIVMVSAFNKVSEVKHFVFVISIGKLENPL